MGGIVRGARQAVLSPTGFRFACYAFTLHAEGPIASLGYQGDDFHRGFGRALERIGRRFGEYFYHPRPPGHWTHAQSDLPKPFMLVPPTESPLTGEPMELVLVLYGEANLHFMIAFAALELLGRDLGVGAHGGRYRIGTVAQQTPLGRLILFHEESWLAAPRPTTAAEVFDSLDGVGETVTLHTRTLLRLKHRGRLVRRPPPLHVLMDRLLGRINTLGALYCGGHMLSPEDKNQIREAARRAGPVRGDATWRDWPRPSEGGDSHMSFGGLLGSITYTQVSRALIPWLALGQWTGVGGKASFGLGHYRLEFGS